MKRVILLAAMLFWSGAILANWTEDFFEDFDRLGLGQSVENALENNISAREILSFIVNHEEKFEVRRALKALFCAGGDQGSIQEAANRLGISDRDIRIALEESNEECGSKQSLLPRDLN